MGRKRFHALYGAPIIHLALCLTMYSGIIVPRLQFLGILGTVVTLIDLPFVTFGTIALSFHYPLLAIICQVVGGTLWWYLLSWAFFTLNSKRASQRHA